jgi:hypothetical protein
MGVVEASLPTNVVLGIGTVTPDRTDPLPPSETVKLTDFFVGAPDPV